MPKMLPRRFEDKWDYKQYVKWLEADLRQLATRGRMHQFYLAKGVRVGGSKKNILLIAGDQDDDWQPILTELADRASKTATGLCRITEHKNDVVLAIKLAVGDLRLDKVIELLNEKLFAKFENIRALTHREWARLERAS